MASKKVIITADDFGYHNHIDDAIIHCASKKVLSNVACFANGEQTYLANKIHQLIEANNEIGIGVHLTISSYKPLIQVLTPFSEEKENNFYFKNSNELNFKKITAHKIQIKSELQLQIDVLNQLLASFDKKVDNLSVHHNIFYFDKELFKIFIEIANENNLPIRCPKRCTLLVQFKEIQDFEPFFPEIGKEGFSILPLKYYSKALYANLKIGVKNRLELMNQSNINSTDYFMVNLYGNQKIEIAEAFYKNLADHETGEQIMHLSNKGQFSEEKAYNGINEKYFEGRLKEFQLLNNPNYLEKLANNINLNEKRTFANYLSKTSNSLDSELLS